MVSKLLWNGLLLPSMTFGMIFAVNTSWVAAEPETTAVSDRETTVAGIEPETDVLQQIEQYNTVESDNSESDNSESENFTVSDPEASNSLGQVTSISQLSDVQPTDWAFQALQSLVERYGCIAGYPDGTYRGQSALTRYEFAAGLNACLDRISELIAASTADLATREDLATLQRLQEEFAAELATIRARVDNLEARVAELEENQFSTTTKLNGEILFVAATPFTEDDQYSDQTIGGYRVRLNFDTSFTGEDRLRARLQALDFGNYEGFGGSAGATNWNFSTQSSTGGSNDIVLDELYYQFPVTDGVRVQVALRGRDNKDWATSTISPFESEGTGSILRFGRPPMYYYIAGGVGAGANVELTDNLSLDFAYAAANDQTADPTPGNGLFNGDYGIIAQLTYLSELVDVGLVYGNSYVNEGFFDDLGVESGPEVANTYGGQVNFKFGALEIGGGVAYVPIRALETGDYDVWSYQGTLALRDFGGEGNLLGVLAGIAPYASDIPQSLITGSTGSNQDNNVIVEGFYRFRINDNISIQPSVIWLSAPENDNEIDSTVVGALRTTFTF